MSIEALTAVWTHSKATLGSRLVILALADFANHEFECWPAVGTIAKLSKLSERNTRTCLRKLEEIGEISVVMNDGRNGSNLYKILLAQREGAKFSGGERRQSPGAKSVILPPADFAPKPSVEPSVEPSVPAAAATGASRHKEFIDLWTESFQQQFDRAYAFKGGPDGSALKRLLGSTKLSAGELMALVTRAWAKKGPKFFWCEKAVTIVAFCTRFNEIQHELDQTQPGDIPKSGAHVKADDDPDVQALYELPPESKK